MKHEIFFAPEAIQDLKRLSARNRSIVRDAIEMRVKLSEVKDQLSKYLRVAESEEVIITRHGKPAGVLVGFATEDDWFDYKLENDPQFLARVAKAWQSLREGRGVRIEDLADEMPSA